MVSDLSWASRANYKGFDKILESVEDEKLFGTYIFNLTATKLLSQTEQINIFLAL